MKEYLKLGWRNIWRNKRRTLITISSIFFAIILSLIMRSMQLGSYENMIDNAVGAYTGYIQIHKKGYWKDKNINNLLEYTEELKNRINNTDNVKLVVPRLESGALVSSGKQTKVAGILGIDTEKENSLTKVESKIVKYKISENCINRIKQKHNLKTINAIRKLKDNYYAKEINLEMDLNQYLGDSFTKDIFEIVKKSSVHHSEMLQNEDKSILIGSKLAEFLHVNVGDTLILMSTGYHGASASGLYPIKGIVKLLNINLDNSTIYMPLKEAQNLFSCNNKLTSIAINLTDPKIHKLTAEKIKSKINRDNYETMTWEELSPELLQQIESDNGGGIIMLGILYIILAFGIFGTILMMIGERKKELGIMIAIGMKRIKLATIICIELFYIGIIGAFSAICVTTPILYFMHKNPTRIYGNMAKAYESFGVEPVIKWAFQFDFIFDQVIVITTILLICMIYPLLSISRLNVINSIR